jgi:hypothetical protein
MHVDDKSAEGALVNSHYPGAIAWSDGDLDLGLDDQNKVKTRTGSLRISELGRKVRSGHSLQ